VKWRDYLADFEWHLFFLALTITAIGVVFIWSSTRDSLCFANKAFMQVLFALVCIPVVFLVLRFGYINVRKLAYPVYFLFLFMLLFLHIFGGSGHGAARWFDLKIGINLQPSEFMKVAIIVALARHLMYKTDWRRWSSLIIPFVMTFVPMILIVKQPDLGTALLFVPILFGMIFAAGARAKHLILLILAGAVMIPLVYTSGLLHPYQKSRITSFLQHVVSLEKEAKELHRLANRLEAEDLSADRIGEARQEARELERQARELKQGSKYQQYYSQVLIGSGGIFGQKLSRGPLNRLDYLPESHTDFIFAILGEEWGFLGCSTLLLLYFLMVAIIFGVARRTRESFGRYVCCGVGVLFGAQVFVNTAITVGLLPVTGLTLPHMSYGGSSLLSSFIALGLVLDVGSRRIRVFSR
jgi:rod shape determining protein RodA